MILSRIVLPSIIVVVLVFSFSVGRAADQAIGRLCRRSRQRIADEQMFSVPWRKNVEGLEAGPAQVGRRALPDGRPRCPMDRRRNQHHGGLPRDRFWAAK